VSVKITGRNSAQCTNAIGVQAAIATNGVCILHEEISRFAQLTEYIIGKVGKDSAAARFAAATPSNDFSIQNDKPYAEVC
jgi:hypothetical protein